VRCTTCSATRATSCLARPSSRCRIRTTATSPTCSARAFAPLYRASHHTLAGGDGYFSLRRTQRRASERQRQHGARVPSYLGEEVYLSLVDGEHGPYREALRQGLFEALEKDSRTFLMGEDVGKYGGTYAVSKGMLEKFGPERVRAWGLDVPPDDRWQAAQEREIDSGHCHALPPGLWPGLARGQFARDAAMAYLLRQRGAPGALLWAGNGHVRRDLGVPRWLQRRPAPAVFAVGFVENDTPPQNAGVFDAVVMTVRAERGDPCEAFRARPLPGGPTPGSQRT